MPQKFDVGTITVKNRLACRWGCLALAELGLSGEFSDMVFAFSLIDK